MMEDDWLITRAKEHDAPVLLLAHGAGAGMDAPFLERISALLAARGITVARFNFNYMARARAAGKKRAAPPRAERLMEEFRARVKALADALSFPPARLFIGGKSMGGRVASMLADDLFAAGEIAGLVCLGYPFHAPGRPQRLRIDHLRALRCPALICQGERDPFGTRAEIAPLELSPAITFCWLPDGDHDLKPRVKSGESWGGNLQQAADCCAAFMAGSG